MSSLISKKKLILFLAACATALSPFATAQDAPNAPASSASPPAGNVAPAAYTTAASATSNKQKRPISEVLVALEGRRIRNSATPGSTGTTAGPRTLFIPIDTDDKEIAAIRDHLQFNKNERYTDAALQAAADSSVKALYGTGFYEHVSITPDLQPDDTVRVTIHISPRLRIVSLKFEGNTEWPAESQFYTGLAEEIPLHVGDILSDVLVKRSVEKLRKKYDDYYPYAQITPVITRNEDEGTASIVFKIVEKEVIKIDRLLFDGNYRLKDDLLRPEIETSSWGWTFDFADFPGWRFVKFSWLTDRGRLHKEELLNDAEKLREYYRSQGFLDVEIPDETIEEKITDTDGHKAWLDLKFKVNEGRR